MSIIFRNESRPDIALGLVRSVLAGSVKLIGHILFPPFTTTEKSGSITVAQRVTGTATTNRAAGATLTGQHVSNKPVNYTCNKYEQRSYVTDEDIKEMGGEDAAIGAMAMVSGYSVINKSESAAAALVINATTYGSAVAININAPFAAITTAAIAVKKFGVPMLFCSEYWLNELVSSPIVAAALLKLYGDKIIQDVQTGLPTALKAVGSLFGVSEIVVGDNDFWKVTSYEDAAAVVAIRPEMAGMNARAVIKALPTFGFQPTFLPADDASVDKPFEVDTVYETGSKSNAVDATIHSIPVVANSAALQIVKLPAAGLVTVTTPLSSVASGTYASAQSVTLSCSTTGAKIYYTTDGSTPDNTDSLYSSAIAVAASATIKAIAIKDGLNDSAVLSVAIVID